jgi:hypothetical protein
MPVLRIIFSAEKASQPRQLALVGPISEGIPQRARGDPVVSGVLNSCILDSDGVSECNARIYRGRNDRIAVRADFGQREQFFRG